MAKQTSYHRPLSRTEACIGFSLFQLGGYTTVSCSPVQHQRFCFLRFSRVRERFVFIEWIWIMDNGYGYGYEL